MPRLFDDFGFQSRLHKAIRTGGGNKVVSEKSGVPLATLNSYLSGKSEPGISRMLYIAEACDTSIDELVGFSKVRVSIEGTVQIPRYDVHLSAGDGHLNDHKATLLDYIPFTREFLQKKLNRSSIDDLSILEATGDSMLPTISDGDLVLIDESDKTEIDGIFAYVQGDFAHIKRLHFMMGGKIEIVSDNNLYSPQILSGNDLEHFRILGRVRWIGHTV